MPDAGYTCKFDVCTVQRVGLSTRGGLPLRDSAGISFDYSGLNPELVEGSPDFTLRELCFPMVYENMSMCKA